MDKPSTSLNFGESEDDIKRKLANHYGTSSSYYSSPSSSSRDTANLRANELLLSREDQLAILDKLKRSPMVKASLALLRTSAVDWKDQAIVLAQSLSTFKLDYIDEWKKANGTNSGTDIEFQKDHMLLLLQPVVKEAEAAITIWRECIWKYDDRIGVSTENTTTSSTLTPVTKKTSTTTPTENNSNNNIEIDTLRHQLDQSQLRVKSLEQEVQDSRIEYNRINTELITVKNALHSSSSSTNSSTTSTPSSTKSIVDQWLDCKRECSRLQARVKELENSEKILKSDIKSLESQQQQLSSTDSQNNQFNSKLISSPSTVFTPIKPSYSPLASKSKQDLESLVERLTFENDTLNQDIRTSKSALDSVQRKAENLERSSRETQQLLDQERLRYLQLANSDSPSGKASSQPIDDTLTLHRELHTIKQQLADQMNKYDTDTKTLKTELHTLQHSLSTTQSDKQMQEEENETLRKELLQLKSLHSNYQIEIQQLQNDAQSRIQSFQKEKSELQSEILSLKCTLEESSEKQQRGSKNNNNDSNIGNNNTRSTTATTTTGSVVTPSKGGNNNQDSGISELENRLRSELRRTEFSNRELSENNIKYEGEITKLRQELMTLRRSEAEARSELQSACDQQMHGLQVEVRKLQGLLREEQFNASHQISELEEQLLNLQNERIIVQRELLSLRSELELSHSRINTLERELITKGQQYEQQRKQWETDRNEIESKLSAANDSESRLRNEINRLERLNAELNEKFNSNDGDYTKLRQDLAALRRGESEARATLQSSFELQMSALQSEIKKLQAQLKEEQSRATQTIGELEGQLLTLQNERIIVQRELLSLRSELELSHGRINTLERELITKGQQYEQQRKQWESGKNGFESQLSGLSETEKRLRQENRRQESLINELIEKSKSYETDANKYRQELINLRKSEAEEKSELQLNFEHQMSALQSEIKKLQGQLKEEQSRAAQNIGELEEQLFNLQNERIIVQRELLSLRSELELSHSRINTLERELITKGQQYELQRKQWETDRNEIESKLSAANDSESRLRNELRRYEQMTTDFKERQMTSEGTIAKLRQELGNVRKSESEVKSELQSSFELQMSALQSEIKKLQAQLKEEQSRATQTIGELEGQLLNLQNERIIVQRELLSLRSELELSHGRINTLERELITKGQQYELQRKQWETDRNEIESRLSTANDSESRLRNELRRYEQIILDLNEKSNDKESNLKDQGKLVVRLKEEMQVATSSLQDLESRLEAVNTDNYTLQRNLASTKSELELMASRVISLEYDIEIRIQQYDQLKKQHDSSKSSLESQVMDLSSSESKLTQECRKLESKRNELCEKIRQLEDDVVRGKQENQQWKKSENEARSKMKAEYETQIQNLQTECRRLQGQLNEENLRASQMTSDFEGYIEELENDKEVAQKELSSLRTELDLYRKKIEILDREHKEGLQLYEANKMKWENHRVALEDQITALTETETRLKVDLKKLEQSNIELTRGNEFLEIDIKNLTKTISRQKEDISAAVQAGQILESRIDTLQADKISMQSTLLSLSNEVEFYRNRSESLEQDLNQRMVDHDRQKKLLESSRYALEAQITLLNESENSIKTELRRAEQSILDLNQKNSDLEQAFSSHMSTCKQADKYASDSVRSVNDTLHQQRQLQEEIQQQIAKIDSLRNNLRITNQLKEELEHQAASMQTKWTSSQIEIQTLRSELDLCRSRNESLEQDLLQKNQEHDQRRRRSDSGRLALEAQVNNLTESESRLRSELRRSEQSVSDMTETLRGYEGDLVKLRQEISTLKKMESQARSEVNASFEQQLSSLQGEVRRLQSQLKEEQSKGVQSLRELENRNHTLQNERLMLLRENSNLKSEAGSLREKLEYSELALAANQTNLGRERQKIMDANRGTFESQLVAVSESENSLRREVHQLRVYTSELEESNRRLEGELEALQSDHKIMRVAHDRAVEDLRKRLYDGQNDILQRQREMQNEEMIAATQNTLELESLIEKLTADNQSLIKSLSTALSEIELTTSRARKLENEYIQMVQQYDVQRKRLESSVVTLTETENNLRNDLRHKEQMEIERTSEISKLKTQVRHLQTAPPPPSTSSESLLAEHRSKWDDQRQSLQKEVQRQVALTMSLKEELEIGHHQKSDLQDQLERLRSEQSNKVSSITTEMATKQKQIDTLESEKESLRRALTEAEYQIDSLNNSILIYKENASKLNDSATTTTRLLQLESQIRELSASLTASNQRHKEDMSQARQTEKILRDSLQRAEQEKLALELQFSKYKLPRESPVKSGNSSSANDLSYSSPSSTTSIIETSSRTINNLQSELTKCKAELDDANFKLKSLTQTCQLLHEELATTKRRTDLLNDQRIQMTREYEEQIQRLESELEEAKHSDIEVSATLQATWEAQRIGLEKDLKNAQALIQVLQDEHTIFVKTKNENEMRIQSLQTEIEKLKTTNRSVTSSSSNMKSYSNSNNSNSGSGSGSGSGGTGSGGFVSTRAQFFSSKK